MDQIHTALLHMLRPRTEASRVVPGDGVGPITGTLPGSLSDSDWEQIARQAEKHGLAPLLFYRLDRDAAGQLPSQVRGNLQKSYMKSARRNLSLYQELNRVLSALSETHLQVIVLKGAYLARTVYKNIALRPMSDLDLLVRPEDVVAAGRVIQRLGYQLDESREPGWYQENHFHLRYTRPGDGGIVELHWHIEPPGSPFRIDLDGLWNRSRPAALAGVQACAALSPEDLLLHLCLHTAHTHTFSFFALRSLYDIAMALSFYGDRLDWDIFQQRAAEWGTKNCAYLTFCLAGRLLGNQPPDWVMQALRPPDFDPRLGTWAEERLLNEFEPLAFPPEKPRLSGRFGHLWTAQGGAKRFSTFVKICFPGRKTIAGLYALPADSLRVFLFYPVRLRDLVQRHATTGWQYVQRNPETRTWLDWEGKRVALLEWMRKGGTPG